MLADGGSIPKRLREILERTDPEKGLDPVQIAPLLAVVAEMASADAVAFAERQGETIVLRDIVLDARHRDRRAPIETELRVTAAEAMNGQMVYSGPSSSLPGGAAIACALPGRSAALVLLQNRHPDNKHDSAETKLALAALSLGSRRTAGLHLIDRLSTASDSLRHPAPAGEQDESERLAAVFGARFVVITNSAGEIRAIGPARQSMREAPAEKAMRDLALRESLAGSPIFERVSDSPSASLPGLLGARFVVAIKLPAQRKNARRIAILVDPDRAWRELDPAGWKVVQAVVDGSSKPPAPRRSVARRRRRVTAGGLVLFAAVAAAMLVPMPDRIRADAQLEAEGRRFVTAAFSSVLKETLVEPGDRVLRGDVVAVLEGENIRLLRGAASARAEDARRRQDAAVREKNITEAELARLAGDAARAELDLLDWQLGQLLLKAPVDGLVLASPLEQSDGAPVREGDLIVEIAPTERLRVRIDVPVRDLDRLPANGDALLYLDGASADPIPLSGYRKAARAQARDGGTVLPLRAGLDNTENRHHPGQNGVVVLPTGTTPLGEILFRNAWLNLRQWSL